MHNLTIFINGDINDVRVNLLEKLLSDEYCCEKYAFNRKKCSDTEIFVNQTSIFKIGFWKKIDRLITKSDLVLLYNYEIYSNSWFAILLLSLFRRKKLFFDYPDSYPSILENHHWNKKFPLFFKIIILYSKLVEKMVITGCTYYTAPNEEMKKYGRKKSSVIYNVKSKDDFTYSTRKIDIFKKKYGITNKLVIFYAGAIVQERGIYELIQAISMSDKYVLVIAGNLVAASNELKYELLNNSQVVYLGKLNRTDAEKLSNIGDIFFTLYKKSKNNLIAGPPNKLFESFVLGKPILVGPFEKSAKIVTELNSGVVVDISPKDILNGLDYIFENYGLLAKNAMDGYNYFNIDTEKRKINALLTIPMKR